ncbi:MAG: DUF4843 domain-containing protein [Candidatus Pseudobacter hemicellulosilyticus]|uniref:DUF4843 domain-containing protein n=1 Tax=Candidatus Pseudobacter hemicellulosilyticus TaxID=3121375 RepID=A0AAJ6BH13_9BACT|nr:MAG: DUF4843 domain-containing protein [Pseudobacter sp.]
MSRILFITLCSLLLVHCSKDEIGSFEADPAINFTSTRIDYTFLGNPSNEYVQEIAVRIIGDTVSHDREFSVEVVADTATTATSSQYEILGGSIPAGSFTGTLRIKLLNSPELSTTTASLKVKLITAKDFRAGNIETSTFTVAWTNKIILPSWSIFRLYFTTAASTKAYSLIVQITGLKTLTASQHAQLSVAGATAQAYKFGDYVKQWNLDHPNDHLKHDDGTLAGQEIVPLYYSRSKYPN